MIALRVTALWTRYYDTDELQHLHAAWCVSQGQLIYRDFFEHHGPLLPLILAHAVSRIASPIHALSFSRGFMLLGWAFLIGITCRMAEQSWKNGSRWILLFLFSFSTFSIKALELRPDVPAACFLMIALWILSRPLDVQRAFILGACAALGTLFTPKIIYPLAGAVLAAAWLFRRETGRKQAGHAAAAALGLLLPWGITVFYFWTKGGLRPLYQCFWVFNAHFRGTFSVFPFLMDSLRQNPMLWLLAAVGFVMAPGSCVLRGALVGWGFGLWRLPVVYPQYYLFAAPALAYLAAAACETLLPKLKAGTPRTAAVLVIVAGLLPGFAAQIRDFRVSNQPQVEEIRCVMERTSPQDKVFDVWTGIPVYRPHAWYFWFLHTEIQAMLPPEILEKGCLQALADPACRAFIWGDSFQQLPQSVRTFARAHYAPAGCGRMFIRKDR